MPDLTPDIAEPVIAACEANADEVAGALSRALDGTYSISVSEAGARNTAELPAGWNDGAGLAIVISFGDGGMIALLPESTGYVPGWCGTPDPTGTSKLNTLAQELSMLLVPDNLLAVEFGVARIENMQEALSRGGLGDGATCVPLTVSSGQTSGIFYLLWPLTHPMRVVQKQGSAVGAEANSKRPVSEEEKSPVVASPSEPIGPQQSLGHFSALSDGDFRRLPAYTRSLFKVTVPVSVCLATKKQAIGDIIELGLGSIVQFDKSYDEMLEMCIGDQRIAEGEVVKVGDNYGLRITSIMLPEERFRKVHRSL
ncbi:MAG: FliM/FliN family flagellar motor switch protein [Pirellulales bacterium]|nr:FliM/FliN family flagellar motor switch protein [Pirellulales bacterium]